MVQIEALRTPECQEGVPSPVGQQELEHGGSRLCHHPTTPLHGTVGKERFRVVPPTCPAKQIQGGQQEEGHGVVH